MKKVLLGLLVLIVVAVVGVMIWLYSSLDSIAKAGIEKYGSEITRVAVRVDGVTLSPADGQGMISGLKIGNPKGFKAAQAFSVGTIEVGVEQASLTKEVVLIHRIAVLSPDINYETTDAGSNFDAIQRNVNQYLGPDKVEKRPGKKMIIDEFAIRDAKVSYSPALMQGKSIDLNLPDIVLHDVGKERGGVTSAELTKEIVDALKGQLAKTAVKSIKGAAKSAGEAAKGIGESAKGWFK